MATYVYTENFTRGDQYVQRFTLVRAGFDFSSTTLRAQVRATPNGALLAAPTITKNATEVGRATGTIAMTGDQTSALPGRCVLELEVEDSNSGFGPLTPVRIFLEVDADYTRA